MLERTLMSTSVATIVLDMDVSSGRHWVDENLRFTLRNYDMNRRLGAVVAVASWVLPLTLGCAGVGGTEPSGEAESGLSNVVVGILGDLVNTGIDRQAQIRRLDVHERRGNSVVISVQYDKLYKFDGVQLQAKALQGGRSLPGFQSTVFTPTSPSGTAYITLTWAQARLGSAVRSDQVLVELTRSGAAFKSTAFALQKNWSALTGPDPDTGTVPVVVGTPPETPRPRLTTR